MISTDNALYYKTQTTAGGSTWSSSWTSLGGPLEVANTHPVVIANSDGRLPGLCCWNEQPIILGDLTHAAE